MLTLVAQQPAVSSPTFDIADGFNIALLLTLFAILAGIVLVALRFRRGEKQMLNDENVLEQPLEKDGKGKSSSSWQIPQDGPPPQPWERDPDWWRNQD